MTTVLTKALAQLLASLPTRTRARVYLWIGRAAAVLTALAAIATMAVLVIPHAEALGITLPGRVAAYVTVAATILGVAATFVSALAHANLQPTQNEE